MRLERVILAVACCTLSIAAAACGGGSTTAKSPDSSKIATATLPAKLPDVKILGNSAVQAGGGSTYTIQSGDTLAGIASRLGIGLDDLRTANPGIDPALLRAGQVIKLPQGTDAPPATAAATVKPGGTATKQPATEAPAATTAPSTSTPPPATEPAATDTPAAPPPPPPPGATPTVTSVGTTYTIQEGDFPAKVADKFGVTLEDLLAANPGINPTDLHIGDVIVIPPKRP